MTRLAKLCSASGALALAFALAAPAAADDYADSVVDSAGITGEACCNDPADALGAPDAVSTTSGFVTIEDGGFLTLDFDDNLCFEDGSTAPDLRVHEQLDADETFTVSVGLQSGTLSGSVAGESETGEELDFFGVAPNSLFNRARLDSTSNGGTVPGVDVDAMECLFTLDQADIKKDFADNPLDTTGVEDEIYAGLDEPQFKAFTITITNDTGVDEAFVGLTFFDVVPAEWDLSPDSEDAFVGSDGNSDGVQVTDASDALGDCAVESAEEHTSNGQGNKLKPEFISLSAEGLADGESCTFTVWVETDQDQPGKGRAKNRGQGSGNPDFTPTSCPVTLNDGVRVLDSSGVTLFEDDDSLIFVDVDPSELEAGQGICHPG